MNVQIYTDGAARGNPDGPGGYGASCSSGIQRGSFTRRSSPRAT